MKIFNHRYRYLFVVLSAVLCFSVSFTPHSAAPLFVAAAYLVGVTAGAFMALDKE